MLRTGRWFADLTRFRKGLDGVPAGSGLAHYETSGGLSPWCRRFRFHRCLCHRMFKFVNPCLLGRMALAESLGIYRDEEPECQGSEHGIGKLVLCDWVWLRVPGCLI